MHKLLISRSLPPQRIECRRGDLQLVLRPFQPDDAERFQKALKVTLPQLYQCMLWPVREWNFPDCLEWVVKTHAEYFMGTVFEWGCFDLKTEELLGSVGIMPANPVNPDNWEIGYWINTSHKNKGLGTLITQIITAVSFLCLKVKRLQVGSMKENLASIRVIEKCGFQYEGTLRSFFPPPPKERIEKGAIESNTDLLYSLLPQELAGLDWYPSVEKATRILPLHGSWITFADIIKWEIK